VYEQLPRMASRGGSARKRAGRLDSPKGFDRLLYPPGYRAVLTFLGIV